MSIRNSILAILNQSPAHGYRLKNAFEDSTAQLWPLNVGQVYTTLARLERDGLVQPGGQDAGRDRQTWRITPAGQKALTEWYQEPVPGSPPRDELALKVLLALATESPQMGEILQTQRVATMQRLQEYTRDKQQTDPKANLPWVLLLDALILKTKAELDWLELCVQRIESRAQA